MPKGGMFMARIPSEINGVTVEFAETVNNEVHELVVEGLQCCIRRDAAPSHELTKIFISSASDGAHDPHSRHYMEKAVDISRINGRRIAAHYGADEAVTAIVNALQESFEGFRERRENFGPYFCKKLGEPKPMPGHDDHLHFSVN
jgi:hypothetical protein